MQRVLSTHLFANHRLTTVWLDRIWNAEYLERLARTYWRFLTRVSLGAFRIKYGSDSRDVVLVGRPFKLLSFHAPEYETEANRGTGPIGLFDAGSGALVRSLTAEQVTDTARRWIDPRHLVTAIAGPPRS